MVTHVARGRKILDRSRAPKVYAFERTCGDAGCATVLSRYNRRECCFSHAPTTFPRVRGRVVPGS